MATSLRATLIATHYADDVLGNRATMERMLREEPTLGGILSFFKLAKTDYKGNERLSRAAGRLYNHFSKLFAEFSARNRGDLTALPTRSLNSIR